MNFRFSSTAKTAVFVAAAAVGAGLVFQFDPRVYAFFPPCFFHKATGLHCVGCGNTRALHALLRGDFAASLHQNALLVPLLALLALLAWKPKLAQSPALAWSVAGVCTAFTILRNLPFFPLTLLAPY